MLLSHAWFALIGLQYFMCTVIALLTLLRQSNSQPLREIHYVGRRQQLFRVSTEEGNYLRYYKESDN
ncbi:hypothetical protein AB6A40_010326 [Gnathostoma spinigerum]|uniref:Uncharacterized protein n=1 Tax=Gnathostoma spinigerum TaxID=75299 RepID=A0ABD6F2I4_9BILA